MKTSSSAGNSAPAVVSSAKENGITASGLGGTATPQALESPAGSRASSAAGVSRPASSAAAAFQQATEAYHEALMAKRLELVDQMRESLKDSSTIAFQSIAAYSHCLDGEGT